jgi:hypothetical protein
MARVRHREMDSVRQRARLPRRWLGLAAVALAAGATIIYLATRSTDQAQVSANVLPVVLTAREAATYGDCSKINAVTYDPHNPCQTFVLLQSSHFQSAAAFLTAETRQLRLAGAGGLSQQMNRTLVLPPGEPPPTFWGVSPSPTLRAAGRCPAGLSSACGPASQAMLEGLFVPDRPR